jgi:hypothetical protein
MTKHQSRTTLVVVGLIAVGLASSAAAQTQQIHMQRALADLQDAKKELALAERDKGGHRKVAAQMVDEAISQVHEGIDVRERDLQQQQQQHAHH